MSLTFTRSLKASAPRLVFKSRVSPFLLRFVELKFACLSQGRSPGSLSGYIPSGGGLIGPLAILWIDSIFITSAPISLNKQPQYGPAQISESSSALMPDNGRSSVGYKFILFPFLSGTLIDCRPAPPFSLKLGQCVLPAVEQA